jgi:probable phosphoglycerate mutase
MRLYLIRHAEPDYPRDALTPRGHLQAQALAARLAAAGIGPIYSSPMVRALETAHPTAERLGLEVRVEPWTRELEDWWIPDETLVELPVWQVDGAAIRALAPRLGPESWHGLPPFDPPHLREGFAWPVTASSATARPTGSRVPGIRRSRSSATPASPSPGWPTCWRSPHPSSGRASRCRRRR